MDPEVIELLEQEIADLEKQLATKNLTGDISCQDFDGAVAAIMKRDNCSRTAAMGKARLKAPDAFEAFQGRGRAQDEEEDTGADFNKLVEAEIRKGAPRSVAGQRVLHKYGARPNASQIQKNQGATGDFMAEVDAVMIEKCCPRIAAMQEVRKRHPDLYEAYQEH
jgi:hypothetical protein